MVEADKKEHLEKLLEKLNEMHISESSIRLMEKMLTDEYLREASSNTKSPVYLNNLNITIKKHLNILVANKDKPQKRIDLFHEARKEFETDIDRELSDLKYL